MAASKYGPIPVEVFSQPEDDWAPYGGNCHCGAVTFSLSLSPSLPRHLVLACNCSICRRNGYLFVYPLRANFQILSGQDRLKGYQFNRRRATHFFCTTCGSSVYFDFHGNEARDILGVNVRMLQDVDLEHLNYRYSDGARLIPGTYVIDPSSAE